VRQLVVPRVRAVRTASGQVQQEPSDQAERVPAGVRGTQFNYG
jgi:hypothetical protein